MTKRFDAASWKRGAEKMRAARQEWTDATAEAVTSNPVTGSRGGKVEDVVRTATADLLQDWHVAIGNLTAILNSDASKMEATGQHYSDTEDEAVEANDRFWELTRS